MANGHAAAFAITVEKEDIIKQNFTSLIELEEMLGEHNETIDSFAQVIAHINLNYDMAQALSDDTFQAIRDEFDMDENALRHGLILYSLFQLDFNEKYKLNITLGYHNSEQGDIYDGVSDSYFAIDFGDVYEVTEQAKNMQKDIPFEISQFVVYG